VAMTSQHLPGDENTPPQTLNQFERAPLKLITAAPRPTKRSFDECKQHVAQALADEAASLGPPSKRARLGAWAASKLGNWVAAIASTLPRCALPSIRQAGEAQPATAAQVELAQEAKKDRAAQEAPKEDRAMAEQVARETEIPEVELDEEATWALLEEAQEEAKEDRAVAEQVATATATAEVTPTALEALEALQGQEEATVAFEEPWFAADAAPPMTEEMQLPDHWQIHLSEEYAAYYYHNALTGVTQWEMPDALQ